MKFIATFVLPSLADAPVSEQASIARTIKLDLDRFSGGDYELAFASDRCVSYLFTSAQPASEMDFKIPRTVRMLVIDVGESFQHQEMDAAGRWLFRNRRR